MLSLQCISAIAFMFTMLYLYMYCDCPVLQSEGSPLVLLLNGIGARGS